MSGAGPASVDHLAAGVAIAIAALVLAPLLLAAIAKLRQRGAARLEAGRVAEAARGGLLVAAIAVVGAAAAATTARLDLALDASSAGAARAGAATRAALDARARPLRAVAFFAPRSEAGEEVVGYLRSLEGARLRLERASLAADRSLAAELGVETDGTLVLVDGDAVARLAVGEDLRAISLPRLDAMVRGAIAHLGEPRRVAYVTRGHGERDLDDRGSADRRIERLRALLVAENVEPRPLGYGEGLGRAIPDDAALVLVLGPTGPFRREELAALGAYVARGGRLLVAIEPEPRADPGALLGVLGLAADGAGIALDAPVGRRRGDASDRSILVVTGDLGDGGVVAGHPAVASVARNAGRAELILDGATALHVEGGATEGIRVVVRSGASAFRDHDGDRVRGDRDASGPFALAVAVERPGEGGTTARALALGDVDALADAALGESPTNALLARDAVRWLAGDPALTTAPEAIEARVAHVRPGDAAWVWGTLIGAPLLVLGLGAAVRRRLVPRS